MKLDPTLALAINMHAGKGVYALLLGSGVSVSAGVPSGWGVMMDLIREVAAADSDDAGADPAEWYRGRFKKEPDYSQLLADFCPTQELRQQYLRKHFEATDDERAADPNAKRPTAAHRAVAELVGGGYVRVILTTNFDRLTEQALQERQIEPDVLLNADDMRGSVPLVHGGGVVVAKLHGDYRDTRAKNTVVELSHYARSVDRWLDRVLDDFGLIVCGWSGEWDHALRNAIARGRSRRYGFYWATRDRSLKPVVRQLVRRRHGTVIPTKGADEFLTGLRNQVRAVADVTAADHPMTTAAAVATAKRYLSPPAQPIPLHDLLLAEVDRVRAVSLQVDADMRARTPSAGGHGTTLEQYADIVREYVAATGTLRRLCSTVAFWGGASVVPLLVTCVERLGVDPMPPPGGALIGEEIHLFPVLLILYAAGVAFVGGGHFVPLADMLVKGVARDRRGKATPMLQATRSARGEIDKMAQQIPGHAELRGAFSYLIAPTLGVELAQLVAGDAAFDQAFDDYELLASMLTAFHYSPDAYTKVSVSVPGPDVGAGRFVGSFGRSDTDPRSLWPGATDHGKLDDFARGQPAFRELIAANYFGDSWTAVVKLLESAQRSGFNASH